jgi:DNA invertase Pin-like site-specific DNA recombinase
MTPSRRFFFHPIANLAEMERALTIERSHADLEIARKLDRKSGLETPNAREQD